MIGLLSRWSVTRTMRVISSLSLVIFLVIIGLNYRAIHQVHAIESTMHQTTQRQLSLWGEVALKNAQAEALRHQMGQDAAAAAGMHGVLDALAGSARAIQDGHGERVLARAGEYRRLFDALALALRTKGELVTRLQERRGPLEEVVYGSGEAALESAIVDLVPGEVRYLWTPTPERARALETILDRLDRDASGKKVEEAVQRTGRDYRAALAELQKTEAEVKRLGPELEKAAREVATIVAAAVAHADQVAQAAFEESEAWVNAAQERALTWTLIGILVPIWLTYLFDRSFSQRIRGLMQGIDRVAEGNLSEVIQVAGQDEIAVLATTVNAMRGKLDRLITNVETAAGNVFAAAAEISGAMDGQAATSLELSASVAEISTTMEELSASSTQIAEHARSVVDIALNTWKSSKAGAEAMDALRARMGAIEGDNQKSLREIVDLGGKSKEITRIMELIDGVADQTKLIAFNAALEASSAGESGRRFGVVAGEIRRLADSVSHSTGEIAVKVEEIQAAITRLVITSEKGAQGIQTGMGEAAETSLRLTELVDAVHDTTDAAKQISLSTEQQKIASSQVVTALREIVQASTHTAQSVERTSAVARAMVGLSAELKELVGQFKLSHEVKPAG